MAMREPADPDLSPTTNLIRAIGGNRELQAGVGRAGQIVVGGKLSCRPGRAIGSSDRPANRSARLDTDRPAIAFFPGQRELRLGVRLVEDPRDRTAERRARGHNEFGQIAERKDVRSGTARRFELKGERCRVAAGNATGSLDRFESSRCRWRAGTRLRATRRAVPRRERAATTRGPARTARRYVNERSPA